MDDFCHLVQMTGETIELLNTTTKHCFFFVFFCARVPVSTETARDTSCAANLCRFVAYIACCGPCISAEENRQLVRPQNPSRNHHSSHCRAPTTWRWLETRLKRPVNHNKREKKS